MPALIVNNVLSSAVDIQYQYLETSDLFGYKVVGKYEIDLSDINIEQGDTVLLNGRDAIKDAYGRPNITARIGADDYINGKITTFNFEAGSLVGAETVSITIEESRGLDDYSASEFAKYIPNPHAISSFSETYSFSRSGGTYSSTRDISLTYEQMAGGQFLNDAKTFLTNYYFANRPAFGYQEDGISEDAKIDKNFRGLISETYDLIGLTVRLSEKVNTSYVDEPKGVGRKETQTLKVDEAGFLDKTFTIELTSLRQDSERTLTSAMANIIDEKKTEEAAEFGTPFSISKAISKDAGTASLTISFSTNPANSQETLISYSGSSAKEEQFVTYSLNITFSSAGKNNKEKFINSKAAWISEQPFYQDKIQRLFHPLVNFFEKSRKTTFDKSKGTLSETVGFTTDSAYNTSEDGLLKFQTSLSKTHQIDRIEKYFNINSLKDEVVTNSLKTVGQAQVSAEAIVSQSMGIYKAKEILESKTSVLNDLVDEGVIHITSDVIKLSLGGGKATRSIDYIFINE
jgi:hypothetical protein